MPFQVFGLFCSNYFLCLGAMRGSFYIYHNFDYIVYILQHHKNRSNTLCIGLGSMCESDLLAGGALWWGFMPSCGGIYIPKHVHIATYVR
jgi:hypothetical protein